MTTWAKALHWIVVACLVVLAVDIGRVPGFYVEMFPIGYTVAAIGMSGWILTRRYGWLRLFGASLFVCSWARAASFLIWEPHRLAGTALNVMLAVIAVLWVERGGRDAARVD